MKGTIDLLSGTGTVSLYSYCPANVSTNNFSYYQNQHKYFLSHWICCLELIYLEPVFIREKQPFADVLKNIAIFTGKHLFWSLFLMKLSLLY